MKSTTYGAAVVLAATLVLLHLGALGWLAAITPWTPDERGYLATGRSLVLGGALETPEQRFQGPLGLLANQIFVDGDTLDLADPTDQRLRARLGMLVFPLLLLGVVFAWSRALFGPAAALLATFVAAVDPNLLAYGCLLSVDVALAATAVLVAWLTWRWLSEPTPLRLAALGAASGAMLATKYIGLLLVLAVPAATAIAVLRGASVAPFGRQGGSLLRRAALAGTALLAAAAVALAVLYACYLFRFPPYDAAQVDELASGALRAVAALPGGPTLLGLLPEPFVLGADYQASVSRELSGTFLDYDGNHWAYHSVTLLTKLPLGTLLLLAWSLATVRNTRRHAALCSALPVVLLLGYLSFANSLQMGIRYLLPIVPLIAIRAGGLASTARAARPLGRTMIALCCGWILVSVGLQWPQYIGWFNELTGGPAGAYRLFADGNCDWYQRRDPGRAALLARHPDLIVLRAGQGPRTEGKIAAYTIDLKPPDPERPGRTYHWITRFPVIDHDTAAWLVFDVSPAGYAEAIARGDHRAARDLALAHLLEGDDAQAAEALERAGDGDAVRALRALVTAVTRVRGGDEAARQQAIGAAIGLGQPELALQLLGDASRDELPTMFVLMVRSGRLGDAVELLDARAAAGSLRPIEVMLLAAGRFWLADPQGAQAALNAGPAPDEDDPLHASWTALEQQVASALLAVEAWRDSVAPRRERSSR